jgi:cyanophycinase
MQSVGGGNVKAASKSRNGKNGHPPAVPPLHATPTAPKGTLIVIGGRENKEGHKPILEEVARRIGNGKLVIATLASDEPEEQWATYQKVFRELGVKQTAQLDVRSRRDLLEHNAGLDLLEGATGLFFAGGDQMKITSRFGGTQACTRMREIYEKGGTIAGTSSGASVMSEVMITGGESNSNTTASIQLAAGLGLIPGMIIDQHFAERGRMGRLLAAVGQNPRMLGIGIDEDTAMVVESHNQFFVMGSGAVSVVDGSHIAFSNAAEENPRAPSIFGITIHVLSDGDRFDLNSRVPTYGPSAPADEPEGTKEPAGQRT